MWGLNPAYLLHVIPHADALTIRFPVQHMGQQRWQHIDMVIGFIFRES
jgi:hypothetical protein